MKKYIRPRMIPYAMAAEMPVATSVKVGSGSGHEIDDADDILVKEQEQFWDTSFDTE